MKVSIKKKYVGAIGSGITLVLAYSIIQEFLVSLYHKSNSELILLALFLVFLIYSVNYWLSLRGKVKIADEVSKEISKGDPAIALRVKEHLWKKIYEESYAANIFNQLQEKSSNK